MCGHWNTRIPGHWNNGKKIHIHLIPWYAVSAIPEPEELPLNLTWDCWFQLNYILSPLAPRLNARIYNCYPSEVANQLLRGKCSQACSYPTISKRQLNPKYKQQDISHLLQGKSPFPGSYWGIADMLQIPILHLAFSNLFVYPYL